MATSTKKSGRLKIKWVVSFIGCPKDMRATIRGLGFRRMQQVVEHDDTPAVRRDGNTGPAIVFELAESHDRTGDELRKEGNVCEESDRIARGTHVAAIDRYGVGQRLEGVEADSHRQDHLERGRLQLHSYPGKRIDER